MPFGNSNWPEIDGKMQPRWGRSWLGRLPRVAPPSRPWAERWNPFGIQARNFRKALALARIFHSHFGKSREKLYEKRGANTFECVVEKTRHAGLETCDTAGWEACATTLEYRRVSRRIVARLQRLMATVAANPGRCPGLSCGGLSGLGFAPPFWKKEAMDLPLTERLRGCDTAGWEACATRVCHGFAGFTMKYPA